MGILRASDAQAFDQLGYSVAISGDTAILGAPGEGGGGDPLSAAAYAGWLSHGRLRGP